jgi:hypothetical protein
MQEHTSSGEPGRCLCRMCAPDHKIYDAIRALAKPAMEAA